MRIQDFFLPLLAAATTALAQPSPPAAANPAAGQSTREAALDNLLAERESIQALDAAIAEARKSGVNEQAILEARFLYHVDHREDAAIAALLPEFLKQRDTFKIEDSAIFGLKEDFLAVIEYVEAIAALGKNDKDGFKKHITEAFWLSPRQASAFAPHIERMRLEEAMRAVKIDFTLKLKSVTPGDAIALNALLAGKKALLFHFWSPLSQECEAAMPDFITTARALAGHGIAVASLIVDDSPELITPAREMIGALGDKAPGAWLVDSKDKPLGRDLRIQNLPTMVLVSPDGKVLFNGEPTDDAFWETLAKTDARITRPESGSGAPE
jgi:thiol-disulfide isomerase/thioredoxin